MIAVIMKLMLGRCLMSSTFHYRYRDYMGSSTYVLAIFLDPVAVF